MLPRLILLISVLFLILDILPRTGEVPATESEDGLRDGRPQATRKDAYGDSLPENALARLGTIRLRQPERIDSVAYSPDSKFVASSTYYSCDVRLWDTATGKELALVYSPDGTQHAQRVLFSPDGRYLTYIGKVGIEFWDVTSKRSVLTIKALSPIAFSPDSKLVAGRRLPGRIGPDLAIFDAESGSIKVRLGSPKYPIQALAFSPDGKLLATTDGSSGQFPSNIHLWDTATGDLVAKWVAHHRLTDSLSFSPDGKVLASGGIGGVRLWDVASHRQLASFDHDGGTVAFSPDGKLLTTFDSSGKVHLWDPITHKKVRSIQTGNGWVSSLAFSPDGKKLLTAGGDYALCLWDIERGKEALPLAGHRYDVHSVQFSADGKTLASRGGDQYVIVWDLSSSKERQRFSLAQRAGLLGKSWNTLIPTYSLAYDADGKNLAALTGGCDKTACVWDIKSGHEKTAIHTPFRRPYHAPLSLAFSSDGQTLATVDNGQLHLWSATSGAEQHLHNPLRCSSVSFSPDGRDLAVGGFRLALCDRITGQPILIFQPEEKFSRCLIFSPDGRILASCIEKEVSRHKMTIIIHLWDTASGTLLRTFDGPDGRVACVAFSPDGCLLASAGQDDSTVHIWDVFTGKELAKFTGHRGPVYCVAFSPDGKTVASGSADTTILLWDVSKLQAETPPSITRTELPKELARLWDEMQGKDGAKAYQAIWRLIGAGDDAVAFLSRKLQPVPAPDAKRVQLWIADLDSEDFAKREAATGHLTKLGELAEPALRQALKGKPSLEARKRIENLLADLTERSFRELELRQIRALHALELIGSPAARGLLKKLAGGAPGARLTRDAKLALQRLQRRPTKP